MRKALRDAKKQIRKKSLTDRDTLGLYLPSIDTRCEYLRSTIDATRHLVDYDVIRAEKIAETSQLLEFSDDDFLKLKNLYRVVARKAEEANRTDDLRQDGIAPPNFDKLKSRFAKLMDDSEEKNDARNVKKNDKEDRDARK
jgi:hypothetical protein